MTDLRMCYTCSIVPVPKGIRISTPKTNGDSGNMTGAMRLSSRQGQALALLRDSLKKMEALRRLNLLPAIRRHIADGWC